MIIIKISADNERLLKRAQSPAELRGAVDMVLDRIEQARAVKEASKRDVVEPKAYSPFNWKEVLSAARDVLGEQVTAPPFPDHIWYQNIQRKAKLYGLTREKMKELCEKVQESYLAPPYQLSFIVNNAERFLTDGYKSKYTGRGRPPNLPSAPRSALPSLPED